MNTKIISFFQQKGYRVLEHIDQIGQSYKVTLDLWKKDYLILSTVKYNTDLSYAKEEGYKDLFQRFCCKDTLYSNPFFMKYYLAYNKQNYGYKLDKNEKKIETHYKAKTSKSLSEYYYNMIQQGILINEILDSFVENREFIGIPYVEYDTRKIYYLDPRVIQHANGNIGFGCGLTLEESLKNSMMSVLHQLGKTLFFTEQIQNKLVLSKLSHNGDFLLFDLSYNFHIPILLGIKTKDNQIIKFDFATSFDYEIAYNELSAKLQFNDSDFIEEESMINSYGQKTIFNYLLNSCIYKNKHNDLYKTNPDLTIIKQIFDNFNISFVYRNESLCENLFATTIFSHELPFNLLDSYQTLVRYHDKDMYDLCKKYRIYLYPYANPYLSYGDLSKNTDYISEYCEKIMRADYSYPLFTLQQGNILLDITTLNYSKLQQPGNIFHLPYSHYNHIKNNEPIMLNEVRPDIASFKYGSDVPDEVVQLLYFNTLHDFIDNEYSEFLHDLTEIITLS